MNNKYILGLDINLHRILLVMLMTSGLLFSSCGGGSSPTPSPTPSPAPTGESVRLSIQIEDWSGGSVYTPLPGATIQVDQVDYVTDANGDVFVTGVDVGLHDVHVFSDNYSWISIYQFTANTTGNTFTVWSTASTPGTNNQMNENTKLSLEVNLPVGANPSYNSIAMTFTDSYGNMTQNQAYLNSWVADPYTGAQQAVYMVNFQGFAVDPFNLITGTVTASELACDPYGFNCMETPYNPVSGSYTTSDLTTWGVADAAINLTASAQGQTTVAPITADSRIVFDVNISNSPFAPGSVWDSSKHVNVMFEVVDTYGNIREREAYIRVDTSSQWDAYTGVWTRTVASGSARAVLDLSGVPLGTTLTGNLSVFEVTSWTTREIANYVDLGQATITTTEKPRINTWAYLPGTTISAAFSTAPVLPVLNKTTLTSIPLALNIANSINADPYTIISGNNSYIQLDLSLANGNSYSSWVSLSTTITSDIYGNWISTVSGGSQLGYISISDSTVLPGDTITGVLTATETTWDQLTGNQVDIQFVDLGLHTFTVGDGGYWYNYRVPSSTPSQAVDITFPVVPPTPSTILTVQSITPPTGMLVESISLTDSNSALAQLSSAQGVTLPHTFSSIKTTSGTNINVSVSAYDPNTLSYWEKFTYYPVGSIVDMTPTLTTMPSISPYQQGSIITFDFLPASGATIAYLALNTQNHYWNILTPIDSTSVTLPTVPLGVANPWVLGTKYDLDYGISIVGSYTYQSFTKKYLSGSPYSFYNQSMNIETIGGTIPYTY